MAIKGIIDQDYVPVNKFTLTIADQFTPLPMVFTKISGIEEELDTVELPDRTVRTSGRPKPIEFEVTQPMHHEKERLQMELWFAHCQDPVSPTYKKIGTLNMSHQSGGGLLGGIPVAYFMEGLFITKRSLPDLDLENDGDMAEITWTLKADTITPVTVSRAAPLPGAP